MQDFTKSLLKASDESESELAELKRQREEADSQLGCLNQVRPSPPSIPPHIFFYPHTPYFYLAPLHHHCTTSHHPYLQPLPPSQENLILAELGLPDIPAQHKDAEQGQEHEEAEQGQEHEEDVADLLREAEQLYAAGMDSFKNELDYKRVLKWGDVLLDYDEA